MTSPPIVAVSPVPWARLRLLVLALLLLLPRNTAIATEGDDGEASTQPSKRPMPDYDGRGPRPASPDEVAAWIPRILLGPLFLTNEFAIRRPLRALGTAVEQDYAPQKLKYVMTFGTGDRAGIFPTAFLSFGFRPSIGATFWANQSPSNDARFRAHFAFGGPQWWLVDVRQRFFFGTRRTTNEPFGKSQVYVVFRFHERPDYVFYGLGPDAGGVRTRFFRHQLGGTLGAEIVFGHLDGVGIAVGLEDNRLGPGSPRARGNERSIEEIFDVANPEQVPGFGEYTLGHARLVLQLDTRRPRPANGTGLRLELDADVGRDLRGIDSGFLRYGGTLCLFLDLSRNNHVLSLRQRVQLVEPLSGETVIPMTELPSLGGHEILRGHVEGRYRGHSAWVTSLQYTYPIWVFLDGIVFADVGNVFGHNFEGLGVGEMALSFGIGMRTNGDRDSSFHMLVGVGTTPFADAEFEIDSFRLVVGAGRGF